MRSQSTLNLNIDWVLCPGSILPVHPDAVKDDGEFHVEDEVDDTSKRGNYHLSSLVM